MSGWLSRPRTVLPSYWPRFRPRYRPRLRPRRWPMSHSTPRRQPSPPSSMPLLLALVLSVRLPLVEANAVKLPDRADNRGCHADLRQLGLAVGSLSRRWQGNRGFLGSRSAVSEQARHWIVGLLITVIVGEFIQLSYSAECRSADAGANGDEGGSFYLTTNML
jgi:hypothetical protein